MNVLKYLEDSANRFPNKTAVSYKDTRFSFDELRTVSKQIGATIKYHRFENSPIGVIVDRNIETLAFFLGIAYSNNFYVPIDPDIPTEKLCSIINDSNMGLILGAVQRKELLEKAEFSGVFLSIEDVLCETIEFSPCDKDTPLYMVYTSGSTGKPKGVLKSHGAVNNYIEAFCSTFDFSEEEVIGNQTPFFFDASAKDIYMALKLGATLEIIPSSLFAFPTELIEFLNQKKISFVSWVPSVLSLVSQLNPFSYVLPTTLRRVFFVGEAMPMKHLNKWRSYLPNIQYVNLYGQSEIAGICCYYDVVNQFENTDTLPMGKPLCNCKVYLVDDSGVITTPNKTGEIYIVSDALALCYYNDEEKTNRSFIMRDFGNGEVRCFRTGDLAKYDDDYNLLFASRADFQIKHMGRRIELGEIEAITNSLDEINCCCCLYNQEKKKLVLFCQLSDGINLNDAELRTILKAKLSSYMLPAKIHILEKMPLSANGKINRQELKNKI